MPSASIRAVMHLDQIVQSLSWAIVFVLLASGTATAGDRVYPAAADVEPLALGSKVPAARVETVLGEPVDIAAVVRDRGALLVFYRGGW